MIKRALGLWAGDGVARRKGSGTVGDEDDSDEDLTAAERRKLERRFLPGHQVGTRVGGESHEIRPDSRGRRRGDSDADDDDDLDEDEDSMDDDSDDEPAMPPEKEKPIRGKFQCQLCPDKILLNEKLLEAHLQSAAHKKNERRFERAKAMGLEAFVAECTAKAEARKTAMEGGPTKRKLKNKAYWEKKRDGSKRKNGKAEVANLTTSEIDERKHRFQLKKARRLARRQAGQQEAQAPTTGEDSQQEAGAPAPTTVLRAPNRKARRLALQDGGSAADVVPGVAEKGRLNRKARRLALQGRGGPAGAESGAIDTVVNTADPSMPEVERKKKRRKRGS